MKHSYIILLIALFNIQAIAQTVVDPKGTKIQLDSSKWKTSGNDIYNKNIGKIGIGTPSPSAQLHTTGTVRLEGIGTNSSNTKILTADASGNITTRNASDLFTGNGGRTTVVLSADVVNNNSNSLIDLPGLSFNITAGITYRFYAIIPYTSANKNNGSRWTLGAPIGSVLHFTSRYTLSESTETINYCNDSFLPLNCNNNSMLTGNLAIIQGVIKSPINGTLQLKFASATAGIPITAKAGGSLEYW